MRTAVVGYSNDLHTFQCYFQTSLHLQKCQQSFLDFMLIVYLICCLDFIFTVSVVLVSQLCQIQYHTV